jgi:3-hydroxy-D-aspartate aldolase
MQPEPARIGAPLEEIDTPALVVDLDAFDRNISKMAAFAASVGVAVRPHAKTHKCPAIARRQMAHGAVGLCAQKVGEAEAMVAGGIRDVLVTNEVVDSRKLKRLAALAQGATIGLCFDSAETVELAGRAAGELGVEFGALVEIEVGMGRCGVEPGRPARDLARRIADTPNLRFRGLQAYHGGAQHLPDHAERERAIAAACDRVRATLDALAEDGLSCEIIGGAGTGTFRLEATSGLYTELQVGSYIFMDTEYARIGGADGGPFAEFEHSLFVLASVMSMPAPGRAILDAGLKSYSVEKGLPWVHGLRDVVLDGVSDEHGKLTLGEAAKPLRLGAKVPLIPSHCDPTVNLHDWFVGIRGGMVDEIWPITGRGASS